MLLPFQCCCLKDLVYGKSIIYSFYLKFILLRPVEIKSNKYSENLQCSSGEINLLGSDYTLVFAHDEWDIKISRLFQLYSQVSDFLSLLYFY